MRTLALDGVVTFEVGCTVQTFAPGLDAQPAGFELLVCGERPGVVRTADGLGLVVDHGLAALADADLIVVPARYPHDRPPGDAVVDALRAARSSGATVASICLGAFVLAYAGLLDDRPATTHWAYSGQLAGLFPRVRVRERELYIDDGDIVTSAGLAAGLDMCLHLVRRELGAAAAARIASWNVVAPHRDGGQAQFIPQTVPSVPDGTLAPLLEWALGHLHEPLPVTRLARHARVSERTLARQFRAQLGVSATQWILSQRVARARELLETGDASLDRIARLTGFPNAEALRKHVRRHTAVTPSTYRRAFRERHR
nr:helix-turn-helix domain-containing protein [Pseudonocardia spinosispora]